MASWEIIMAKSAQHHPTKSKPIEWKWINEFCANLGPTQNPIESGLKKMPPKCKIAHNDRMAHE